MFQTQNHEEKLAKATGSREGEAWRSRERGCLWAGELCETPSEAWEMVAVHST